jgi:DNA-binding response OmpR family regulator
VRILVVEDNPKLAAALQRGMREQGYAADICHDGFEGEALALAEPYDAIVLDRMLPDRDGIDICRALRRQGVRTPILLLTALSATAERVAGLDAGADDYLPKPFDFEELLARVRALLRRGTATESTRLVHADLELDLVKRVATRGGSRVELSSREFALLELLMRNAGRVLTRTTILQKVWDLTNEPSSNVVDVYVSALRKKIDRHFEPRLLHTVHGTGYRFGAAQGAAPTSGGAPG